MTRKKILLFVPFLKGTGGTETVIRNLQIAYRQSLKKKEYDMMLVSFGGTIDSHWQNEWEKKVYSFSKYRALQNIAYIFLMPVLILYTLFRENPDIVISTNSFIWKICYIQRTIFKRSFQLFAWYHYSINQKGLSRFAIKSPDRFLAISTGIKEQLISRGRASDSIDVLFNPVMRTTATIPRPDRSNPVLTYIGRIDFDGQKNVSELFEALKEVKGPWRLELYGTCSENDKHALVKMAQDAGFIQKISFKGYHSNVWEIIETSTALVMTSKYEGFPMILCEALSHGVYCISSDCETGPSDILETGVNGKLYEPGNVDQLVNQLNTLVNGAQLPKQKDIINSIQQFDSEHFIYSFERFCHIDV